MAHWPQPNIVNPETRGSGLLVCSIMLLSLTLIVLVIRLWTRFVVLKHAGPDDYLIMVAMALSIGLFCIALLGSHSYGWNRHIWDQRPAEVVPGRLATWLYYLLFISCAACIKISVTLFYGRLLARSQSTSLERINQAIATFILLYTLGCLLGVFFVCNPTRDFWFKGAGSVGSRCIDVDAMVLTYCLLNILSDLAVTIFPMSFVFRLSLPTRQKWALAATFGLGFSACIGGILRAYFSSYSNYATIDRTWYKHPLLMATMIEINFGIMAASAPALKPLFSSSFSGASSSGPDGSKKAWRLLHRSSDSSSRFGAASQDEKKLYEVATSAVAGSATEVTEPQAIHKQVTVEMISEDIE